MPGSKDIEERLAAARGMYEEERKRKEREERSLRRDLALRLRKARREDRNQETINQWKQNAGWARLGRGGLRGDRRFYQSRDRRK